MSSQIATFNFQTNAVRIVMDEQNTPLFVATDVANALGYAEPNRAVRQHCKGCAKHTTLLTAGGKQKVRVIYEPDVYRLIFGSKLESAVTFQDWVFEEVLPTIRKTGEYQNPTRLSTVHDRKPLVKAVKMLVDETGAIISNVWKMVHQRFNVSDVEELTAQQVPMAIEYVHSLFMQTWVKPTQADSTYAKKMLLLGRAKAEANRKALEILEKVMTDLDYSVAQLKKNNSTQDSIFQDLKLEAFLA